MLRYHRLASPAWLLPAALALPLAACNMGSQSGDAPLATASVNGADVVITGQPQAVSAATGQSATLSVTAVDTAGRSLMYQWLKNNAVISGATSSSYTFTPQASDNGASFSVVVTDQNGCLQSLYSSGTPDSDGKRCVISSSATLTVSSGGIKPVAGGIGGPGNLDGIGSASRFNFPMSTAQDSAGNTYVADTLNNVIRKITPAGAVSLFAGRYSRIGEDNGPAASATFWYPTAVAVDSANNVYVLDTLNNAIRKITPAGVVSTLAGGTNIQTAPTCVDGIGSAASFSVPQGMAIDVAGNLYVADSFCLKVRKVTPAGVVTTLITQPSTGPLQGIYGVAVNASGSTIYYENSLAVYTLTPSGVSTLLAGNPGTSGSADGTGAAATFGQPQALAVDNAGNVYVADPGNSTIRKVTPTGVVSTIAGAAKIQGSADGSGSAARFFGPGGVMIDSAGNLLVADALNNTIRHIDLSTNTVSTVAGLAANLGYADGTGAAASFNFERGSAVAADSAGNLYIADSFNELIRKVSPGGVVTTLAGAPQQIGKVDGSGSAARFDVPSGVAVDASGTIYVADTYNYAIRSISPAGVVSTLAGGNYGNSDGVGSTAGFASPTGVAVDGNGNVYVADYGNNTIRKIAPGGVVSTIAGVAGQAGSADGAGSMARFNGPERLVVDSAGNIYVTDSNNETIRKITPAGVVSTLAGTPGVAGSADGTGATASFNFDVNVTLQLLYTGAGITLDGAGNLYVADTNNGTIRKITPAGMVSTVAGTAGQVGIQLGGLPSTLGPTEGVVVVGNTLYATVSGASLLSFNLP